jgi:hypothetical protein
LLPICTAMNLKISTNKPLVLIQRMAKVPLRREVGIMRRKCQYYYCGRREQILARLNPYLRNRGYGTAR